MIGDAGQYVGEVMLRVTAVELGGLDQGVDRRGAVAAGVGTGEQIVLAFLRPIATQRSARSAGLLSRGNRPVRAALRCGGFRLVSTGANDGACTGARDGAMARFEVITGPERRRRWSEEQKRAIVAESLAPGAVVTEVARRADIGPGPDLSLAAGDRRSVRVCPGADRAGRGLRAGVCRAASRRSRSSLRARLGCGSRRRSRRRWRRRSSRRCRGDDPGSVGGAGVAGGRPHRHAARHEQPGAAGPGGVGRDPHAGDLYVFRGNEVDLIKILWHDGIGMSLYAKRLERGRFIWPSPADGIGRDHGGAAGLYARRDRLAEPASHLAAAGGRLRAATRIDSADLVERGSGSAICDNRVRDDAPETLPDDIAALKAALTAERAARQQAEARASGAEAMVAHLKLLIAKCSASSSGNRPSAAASCSTSWSLQLEELEATRGRGRGRCRGGRAEATRCTASPARSRCARRLPAHLPRERVVIPAPSCLPVLRRQARQARRGRSPRRWRWCRGSGR